MEMLSSFQRTVQDGVWQLSCGYKGGFLNIALVHVPMLLRELEAQNFLLDCRLKCFHEISLSFN